MSIDCNPLRDIVLPEILDLIFSFAGAPTQFLSTFVSKKFYLLFPGRVEGILQKALVDKAVLSNDLVVYKFMVKQLNFPLSYAHCYVASFNGYYKFSKYLFKECYGHIFILQGALRGNHERIINYCLSKDSTFFELNPRPRKITSKIVSLDECFPEECLHFAILGGVSSKKILFWSGSKLLQPSDFKAMVVGERYDLLEECYDALNTFTQHCIFKIFSSCSTSKMIDWFLEKGYDPTNDSEFATGLSANCHVPEIISRFINSSTPCLDKIISNLVKQNIKEIAEIAKTLCSTLSQNELNTIVLSVIFNESTDIAIDFLTFLLPLIETLELNLPMDKFILYPHSIIQSVLDKLDPVTYPCSTYGVVLNERSVALLATKWSRNAQFLNHVFKCNLQNLVPDIKKIVNELEADDLTDIIISCKKGTIANYLEIRMCIPAKAQKRLAIAGRAKDLSIIWKAGIKPSSQVPTFAARHKQRKTITKYIELGYHLSTLAIKEINKFDPSILNPVAGLPLGSERPFRPPPSLRMSQDECDRKYPGLPCLHPSPPPWHQ